MYQQKAILSTNEIWDTLKSLLGMWPKFEGSSNLHPFNTFSWTSGKNSTHNMPFHWATEPCQSYLWFIFKLFFVLSQFLNSVATTGTNKLCLWVKLGQHYFFLKNIFTGQKLDMTELKFLWSFNITSQVRKSFWALSLGKKLVSFLVSLKWTAISPISEITKTVGALYQRRS